MTIIYTCTLNGVQINSCPTCIFKGALIRNDLFDLNIYMNEISKLFSTISSQFGSILSNKLKNIAYVLYIRQQFNLI